MCLEIITCKITLPKKKKKSFVIRLFSFYCIFKSFVLFDVIRLLKLVFTKSACFNISAKFSAVNLLNS